MGRKLSRKEEKAPAGHDLHDSASGEHANPVPSSSAPVPTTLATGGTAGHDTAEAEENEEEAAKPGPAPAENEITTTNVADGNASADGSHSGGLMSKFKELIS